MRKWNGHFDGKGVYEFLEGVRELQRAYQLTDHQLLRGFPELLRGDAQLWYRKCASSLTTRDEYEPIRAYTTALLTLLRRRGGFDHERVMETLYYNMKPGLRLHIRLKEVTSPEELIQQVQVDKSKKYRHSCHRNPRAKPGHKPNRTEQDTPFKQHS